MIHPNVPCEEVTNATTIRAWRRTRFFRQIEEAKKEVSSWSPEMRVMVQAFMRRGQ
jgi:hypothetical protein